MDLQGPRCKPVWVPTRTPELEEPSESAVQPPLAVAHTELLTMFVCNLHHVYVASRLSDLDIVLP